TADAVGHLDSRVAVALGRLDLHDPGGGDLDDGDRDGPVLVVPDLGHADLLTDDRLGCHLGRSLFRPFSSSAPAGLTGADGRRGRPSRTRRLRPGGPWAER